MKRHNWRVRHWQHMKEEQEEEPLLLDTHIKLQLVGTNLLEVNNNSNIEFDI